MAARGRLGSCGARAFGGLAILGAFALGTTAAPVFAETCLEQVRRFAGDHNLSIDPPSIASKETPGPLGSGDLGQSGGLIEPPPTPDTSVIEPPGDLRYRMPTVPDITPEQTLPERSSLSPSDLAILESILVAARTEAERGQETDCFERLQKARQFVRQQSR